MIGVVLSDGTKNKKKKQICLKLAVSEQGKQKAEGGENRRVREKRQYGRNGRLNNGHRWIPSR